MEAIKIEYLAKLKTHAALKVLLALVAKSQTHGSLFEYAVNKIAEDIDISENSVRNGLKELAEIGLAQKISSKKGTGSIFELPFLVTSKSEPAKSEPPTAVTSKSEPPEGWSKAVGARKTKKQLEQEIDDKISNIYNYINIIHKDINSLSVVNTNIYLTDKELGKLANKLIRDKLTPYATGNKNTQWFAHQMKLMKDLLVEWRTEQVVAAIEYWTIINPTASGISSLRYLMFKNRKGTSNLMVALDYYKHQYLAQAHEEERQRAEEMILKAQQEEAVKQAESAREKEKVDNMNNDEFIQSLMSSFGKIDIKGG